MPTYDKPHYMTIEGQDDSDSETGEEITKKRHFQAEGSDKPGDKVNGKWTTRMKLVALATFMVYFNVFGSMALITPYFPNVAVKMGIKKSIVGLVFGIFPLVGIAVSLIIPSLFTVLAPKTLLSGFMVLAGVAQIAFGFGTKLHSNTSFILHSLTFRLLTSVGASSCYTTVVSIAAQEFPSDYALVIGISETAAGLGAIAAPAVAGAIFQSAGYFWPTMAWGLMMLATAFLLLMIFKDMEFETPKKETGLFRHAIKVMKLPGILLGVEITLMGCFVRTILDPIYAIFGKQVLRLDAGTIGLLYTVVWIMYFLFSAPVGKIADKYGKHLYLLCAGSGFIGLGYLLLGPTPLLKFLPVGTIWLTTVAEILIGVGYALAFIPSMPFLVHSAKAGGMEIDMMTSGVLSGLFTSTVSIGEFVGPTSAGIIADLLDIRWDISIIGLVAVGQTVLLILYAICRCMCSSDDEAEKK